LGVRYEYNTPAVDPRDRATIYDPATQSIVAVGRSGVPRAGYYPDRNNFAPRAGIAWTPDAARKWVLRAGYGTYYDQSALAPSQGLYFSPPYFNLQVYVPSAQFPIFLEDPFPSNYPGFIPNPAFTFQRNLRTPYMQQWNFSVQREVGRARVVELA